MLGPPDHLVVLAVRPRFRGKPEIRTRRGADGERVDKGSAKQNSNQLRLWRNGWNGNAERGWAAEAVAVLSGVFADRESKNGRLAPRHSLQVFPLEGTLLGSDGSDWTAQQQYLNYC